MTTFREILIAAETELLSAELFFGHGYESAHDEAVALVLAAADCSLVDTNVAILDAGYPVTALPKLRSFLTARCQERLPVAYIIGEAWLGHLCFKSDARALVPRSPVAELVLNQFEPWYQGPDPQVIIDVCCGGGSLGMLAKSLFPSAQVLLSDLDSAALSLASENSQIHAVDAIVRADLLSWCGSSCVDIIIANPPYVDADDMQGLPAEYRHEPGLALAGGDDGLDLVRVLLTDAARILRPTGLLILEVGNSFGALDDLSNQLHPIWVDLAYGGHGVAVFMAQDLAQWGVSEDTTNPVMSAK
ncbi:MAG: 50S ribosomal protein L3 N(5)-glutamine methyltransferase [Pseudomonadota bacterium]|nr:50S ribosomal protein L3 N(5)-glutamine methyltransferase [Pseudomonadota bacterium]